MKLKKLAEKAREELNHHAARIINRDFDDRDVALFLIYGRDAFDKEPALFDFANSVAHAQRNRGKFFEAAEKANDLDRRSWLDSTKPEPLGPVGYASADINEQLDSVMTALDRLAVLRAAAEDFVSCLCAIGNRLEFAGKEGSVVGTTNALAVNGILSLDFAPTSGRASVILLNAHLSTLPDGFIDYRGERIHMKRDGPGAELRVVVG